MGAFFGCVYVRGADFDTVRLAAREVAKKRRCRFLVAPEIRGWVALYPSENGQDERVSAAIAKRLDAHVLHTIVHDSDVFSYLYYRGGKLIDQFDSRPDYFGPVSARKKKALRGKPELLQPLLRDPADLPALSELLAAEDSDADAQLEAFAQLLDLPNAATSYDYLLEEDTGEEIEERAAFVHEPELGPEQMAKAEKDAAVARELERLRATGVLLSTQTLDPLEALWRDPWEESPSLEGLPVGPEAEAFAISGSGRYVAVGAGYAIQIWEAAERRMAFEIVRPRRPSLIGFSPAEDFVVISAESVFVHSLPEGRWIADIREKPYNGLAIIHPSGSPLLLRSGRTGVLAVNPATGENIKQFWIESNVGMTAAGRFQNGFFGLLYQAAHGALSKRTGAPVSLPKPESLTANEPLALHFSPDGRLLFCGENRGACVFDWEALLRSPEHAPEPLFRYEAAASGTFLRFAMTCETPQTVHALAHDAERNRLLLGCGDGVLREMNLEDGSVSDLLAIPGAFPITRMSLSPDGTQLSTIVSPFLRSLSEDMSAMMDRSMPRPLPMQERPPDRVFLWNYRLLRGGIT